MKGLRGGCSPALACRIGFDGICARRRDGIGRGAAPPRRPRRARPARAPARFPVWSINLIDSGGENVYPCGAAVAAAVVPPD